MPAEIKPQVEADALDEEVDFAAFLKKVLAQAYIAEHTRSPRQNRGGGGPSNATPPQTPTAGRGGSAPPARPTTSTPSARAATPNRQPSRTPEARMIERPVYSDPKI